MDKTQKDKVLIIDDSEMNIVILKRILSPEYDVLTAKNGRKGIEIARSEIPDVILLDIVMPDIDGFETISELKKIEETRNIPIIFISGLDNSADEEKGLELGGVDYIMKPFSEAVVKLRVRNQIQMQHYIHTIENLMNTDQLTKIPNRRSFDECILMEWNRAKRKPAPLSVLIIDIDNFKKYNDVYGHQQGDVALQSVASVLTRSVKRPGDFAARWGGEEFIVLLPNTDAEGALIVGEHIRQNVLDTDIFDQNGQMTVTVTVSVGVNTATPANNRGTIKDFINFADDALYTAKKEGRNRVCMYGVDSK